VHRSSKLQKEIVFQLGDNELEKCYSFLFCVTYISSNCINMIVTKKNSSITMPHVAYKLNVKIKMNK
jgi:hypothetical protein